MKSKRHSPEQVIRKLSEGDKLLNEGATVAEVARQFGITETTWYRWKNQYGGIKAECSGRFRTPIPIQRASEITMQTQDVVVDAPQVELSSSPRIVR